MREWPRSRSSGPHRDGAQSGPRGSPVFFLFCLPLFFRVRVGGVVLCVFSRWSCRLQTSRQESSVLVCKEVRLLVVLDIFA